MCVGVDVGGGVGVGGCVAGGRRGVGVCAGGMLALVLVLLVSGVLAAVVWSGGGVGGFSVGNSSTRPVSGHQQRGLTSRSG